MDIKIEGWKVTIHNENGDRLELNGEFESDFFRDYENKQLIIANVVGQSEQLCYCGKKEDSRYSPCCSLEHWHDKACIQKRSYDK